MTLHFPENAAPLMPLFYAAWEDGTLHQSEADAIRLVCDEVGVDPAEMVAWLTPNQPPSAELLQHLAGSIRRSVVDGCDLDLACLAEGFANARGVDVEPSTLAAIRIAATTLGLSHVDASADLVPPPSGIASWGEVPNGDPRAATQLAELFWRPFPADRYAALPTLEKLATEREFGISTEAARARTTRWLNALAEAGLPQVAFAETADDGQVGRFIALFETIAMFDLALAVKAGVQFGLFGGSIAFLGDADQRAKYLPLVASMELPGCFAMTERGHGSNVRDLETTATYDPLSHELIVHTPHDHARKEWIGNAARDGHMATVFSRLIVGGDDHGVHAVLVPIRERDGSVAPGVRIEDCGEKMGLHGVDNGMLWFDSVRVPVANLLNRFGAIDEHGRYASPIASSGKRFFTMLSTLVGGRVSVGGAALSASKAALTIAVRFASRRRQFGPKGAKEMPILDYPTHHRRLMPSLAECVALSFAQQELMRRYSADPTNDEIESLAAAMKAMTTRHGTDTIQACREACGGQGYAARNRFADLKADSDVFVTFEGDNTVLWQLVARARLTSFKRKFDDNRISAFLRDFLTRTVTAAADRNFVASRLASAEHLRDDRLQADLLRAREADLLHSSAGRLSRRLRRGDDPFEAFKSVQTHLVSLGGAWGETFVLAEMQKNAEQAPEPARQILRDVSDLYGLSRIEHHLAWFMENGYVSAGKARAIRREVDRLCAEVRVHAPTLVTGFGIPDALLSAPAGVLSR